MSSGYTPTEIPYYEGLIRTTAGMCAPHVEVEYEDIVSIFRIKVWRALGSFDATRSTMTVQRYVFSCLKNQEKDLLKRRRRRELYIEDIRRGTHSDVEADAFEEEYLVVTGEQVYDEVERELPVIPSTLTALERMVIVHLYAGLSQRETAVDLGLSRSEMERTVRSIRERMADWKPNGPPLPERALAA